MNDISRDARVTTFRHPALRLASLQRGRRVERDRAERFRGRSVDHELEIDAVIRQLQEIDFRELLVEFANEIRGVFDANPE